ncbi:hypothetical protein D3C80_1667270 [compost metagenome]
MSADNVVIRSGCAFKVVIVETALRIDQHAAVGEIADLAVQDTHMAAAHEYRSRIAAVLQHQLREVDVRGVKRVDHRCLEHGDFNIRVC